MSRSEPPSAPLHTDPAAVRSALAPPSWEARVTAEFLELCEATGLRLAADDAKYPAAAERELSALLAASLLCRWLELRGLGLRRHRPRVFRLAHELMERHFRTKRAMARLALRATGHSAKAAEALLDAALPAATDEHRTG